MLNLDFISYVMDMFQSCGIKIVAFALLLLNTPLLAFAQSEIQPGAPQDATATQSSPFSFARPVTEVLPNTVDCFDYYSFGSVQVDVEPSITGTVSGVPITFSGNIVNNNPYPIVDGQLLVKVYKITELVDVGTYQNGYPVVDQFFALEDVTIPANGETPVMFNWEIPTYLLSGDYELNTFFMTSKRFNLLGLPFTDDVTGNKFSFSVLGQAEQGIAFDKNAVTLNGEAFNFAAFPPTFSAAEPVVVSTKLVNDTTKAQTVPVTWTLYNWAGERIENKLDVATENVVLAPGETKTVTYTAAKSSGAISFVQAVAIYKDTKSVLNIRFNRDDKQEIRLNFPSMMTYPLVAGQEATVFSCLHSTSQLIVEGGKLVLTLTDTAGKVIHSYTYEGSISGAMMGVKDAFVPDRDIANFTLTASLFKDNQKVEEVKVDYSCGDIDATKCPVAGSEGAVGDSVESQQSIWIIGGLVGLFVLLGSLASLFIYRRRKIALDRQGMYIPPTNGMTMLLLCCCVIPMSVAACMLPQAAEAKSVVVDINGIPGLYQNVHRGDWYLGLSPGFAAVTYKAEVENVVSGEVYSDNEAIPIGTRIRVHQTDRLDTDIFWAGSGYSFDSPYGNWVTDAGNVRACTDPAGFVEDVYQGGLSFHRAHIRVDLNIAPPEPVVVSASANLSCIGNICTVLAEGPVSVALGFPATFGKFYFRYDVWDTGGINSKLNQGQCYSSVDAMRAGPSALYNLPVSAKTISFDFEATVPTAPPTAPVITGDVDNTYFTDDLQRFKVVSTDPDNNAGIKYGMDWDNNGNVDYWAPIDGSYRESGDPVFPVHTWINEGTYTFRAIAKDRSGALSDWTSHTVTIAPHPPVVTLRATGCQIEGAYTGCYGTAEWLFKYLSGPYSVMNKTYGNFVLNKDIDTLWPAWYWDFEDVLGAPADTEPLSGTAEDGDNSAVPLKAGPNTIEAWSGGVLYKSVNVDALCPAGFAWYGGACVDDHMPELTLLLNPKVVREGDSTIAHWTISDLEMNTCIISRPGSTGTEISSGQKEGDTEGDLEIGPITSMTNVKLVCTSPLHVDVEVSDTVNVVPTVYER